MIVYLITVTLHRIFLLSITSVSGIVNKYRGVVEDLLIHGHRHRVESRALYVARMLVR